ncbi:MAG: glutamyl-tRNA reductase [Pseudomonadota bacterium]
MPLFVLGVNHNTAPVHLREQVVFDPSSLPDALSQLRALPGVDEVMVLSTCNRTEIIGSGSAGALACARDWLINSQSMNHELQDSLFEQSEEQCARHVFRVAAGLDSVILGEPQIAGQLKEAYRQAQASGAAGSALEKLCASAFSSAKRIRTETAIGQSPVSVAYAAVKLASRLLGQFDQQVAVLIGAGQTIDLVARHLRRAGIGRLFIANRTESKARSLAAEHEGLGLGLGGLPTVLAEADIIVSSTASPEPVVHREHMEAALKNRRRRQPLFVADIAVPRDIEASVADLEDIYLYTVDDLNGVISDSLEARQRAAIDAEGMIEQALERFSAEGRGNRASPIIRSVRERSEQVRDELLAEAERRAQTQGPEKALAFLANTLTNRFLHPPSEALRKAAEHDDQALLDAAAKLFDLDKD